jgi:hypothetical protein
VHPGRDRSGFRTAVEAFASFGPRALAARGGACHFNHHKGGKNDENNHTKGSKGTCHQWSSKGPCTFGDKCRFSHEGKGGNGAPGKASPGVPA